MESPPGISSTATVMESPPGIANGDHETVQAVREALLADVNAKVKEKVEDLWKRGQQAMKQMEERYKDKESKLSQEVARMAEKQRELEVENEQLKQHITTLAGRFQMLGAVFAGGSSGTPGASLPPGIDAPFTPSLAASVAGESPQRPFSNVSSSASAGGGSGCDEREADGKELPYVPPFPNAAGSVNQQLVAAAAASIAASLTGPTTPLSLVEALNTNAAQAGAARKPLSLASSLSMPIAASTPEPPGQRVTFSFTIRKADDADLGLNVSHDKNDNVLRVEDIRPAGAVESWNRACTTSNSKEKAVRPGDRIVSVNDVSYDPEKMLLECKDRKTLKLTIVRGGSPIGETATTAEPAGASATVLRAEASVFVPRSEVGAEAAAVVVPPESTPEAQDTDVGSQHSQEK